MKITKLLKSVLLLSILLLGMTVFGWAQNNHHTVKKGETLFNIAKQYNVEVQQLKEWNNLQGNNLSLGRSLIIKKAKSPKNTKTHIVKPHETLFSISKQYHINISELKSWNNLQSNSLSVGQHLTIYSSNKTTPGKQSISVDQETQDNTYYTVKNGDTIFKIAQEHGMEVDKLKSLNDLSSNNIRVGQRLTVYGNAADKGAAIKLTESSPQGKFVTYRIPSGSVTLQDLLPKFKMDEQEFRALNPDIRSSHLQAGQKVNMLAPPTKKFQNPYLTNANMKDLGSTRVSEYNSREKATPTTNGELYNPDALTAAHPNIALGSVIFIQNPQNHQGTYVRINDRTSEQKLKLSAAAWKSLHFGRNKPKVTIYQTE